MSVVLPACSAEWIARVKADHTPVEEGHAQAAGIELARYQAEATKRIRELLRERRLQLRMRPDGLEGFMSDGYYRNRFHGGISGGVRDKGLRIEAESIVLGITATAVASQRPIYGYLQGADEAQNELNGYGSIQLVLADALVERATIVLGDSLGSTFCGGHPAFAPAPLGDPSLLCSYAGEVDIRAAAELAAIVDPCFPYAELQIYGGLEPRDISFITFSQNKLPKQATMVSLEQAEIRYAVVDGYPT
jgi:hypothetical protein